jgi:hypothetical protein
MKQVRMFVPLAFVVCLLSAHAQVQSTGATHNDKFGYSFSNFVWWSDRELRAELKKRIPSLGDEFARGSTQEEAVRTALTKLLRDKGVEAHVQSLEPSADVWSQKRIPEAPQPSIVFSIATPPDIKVDKLVLFNAPAASVEGLQEIAARMQGRQYASTSFWSVEMQMRDAMARTGYLSAAAVLNGGLPRKEGDQYWVPINAEITAGSQYHVSTIKADGGPLLKGRDLSPYFSLKPGDVATPNPFGSLTGQLRSYYWHFGYPDVEFSGSPTLDRDGALASYEFKVIPGELYHLGSVKIENLSAEQQVKALTLLGLKQGDIYDALAVTMFSRKLDGSPLDGYDVSYSPKEDKEKHVVDLTLHFYKK